MQKQSNRVSQNLAKEIVFSSASEERPPWSVCGRKCSRSASLFIIQSFVSFILTLTSVVCIILSRSWEKKILGSVVIACGGFYSSYSKIIIQKWTKLSQTKIEFSYPWLVQQHLESPIYFSKCWKKDILSLLLTSFSLFINTSRNCTLKCKKKYATMYSWAVWSLTSSRTFRMMEQTIYSFSTILVMEFLDLNNSRK